MAVYKVINRKGDYRSPECVEEVLAYTMNPEKTRPYGILGGAVIPQNSIESMNGVIRAYGTEDGLHLRHTVLAFGEEDDISYGEATAIAEDTIAYYSDQYQIVAAVHDDNTHPHIHLVMNTTNYTDGSKYNGDREDYHGLENHLNQILREYGTRVLLDTSYNEF